MENALLIFMKAPLLGKVKTRMQPDLSPKISLELYKAMGKDLANIFSQCNDFDLIIQYTPENARPEMEAWLGKHLNYKAQQGASLGEKLQSAFSHALTAYKKVCIIGSDLPTLQKQDVVGSFDKLNLYDLVLGPAIDGGYYLVALKAVHPEIFQGVDWGTGSVLSQTLQNARQNHLGVYQLSVEEDIDTFSDLLSFWKHAAENEHILKNVIPNTIRMVKRIFCGE